MKNGFIRPSSSQYSSPIVVAAAANGKRCLCIDYTQLNLKSKGLPYPLPNMKSILQNQRGSSLYAKIDLKQGFHQIPLEESSRYLTAFVCEAGLFEWTVIPFGVKKGQSYFQQQLACRVSGLYR